jgi:N-acetylated-alpha-linked acidic dipeptidase
MLDTPLPSIPIQPISYGDAQALLLSLTGNPIPYSSWAGGFNLSFIGPGTGRVRMDIQTKFNVTPIWNVVATITGSIEPDRYVILGSHRGQNTSF